MKKFITALLFSTSFLLGNYSHAEPLPASQTLTAAEVAKLTLEVLIQNSDSVSLEGDVLPNETLAGILAQGILSAPGINKSIENFCVFIHHDFIYECHLSIRTEFNGQSIAETTISFETFADLNQQPTDLVINKARISRGD